jgi:pimeloyl-ACP methyl ester carboxylesterase
VLVVTERFGTVEESLGPALEQVHRSGSARGLVAAYSTLGLLKLRLGALPEADAAARVALYVLQEGDFAPGLGFAATVLSDVAVEAGQLDEAQRLLDLLPRQGWPAGVGTVLIPAARGRLRLAQGRAAEALAEFRACAELFGADMWGMSIRETGYVHARAGAALALLRLGRRQDAIRLADAELADVRVFDAPRALGIALRVAGLARAYVKLGIEGRSQLEEVPKYLFAHPGSEAARAARALPEDPEQIPKAIAQSTWNVGCTTKFAWPIADHGLGRRLHRIQVPTLVVWGRDDALVPVAYAKEFGSRIAGSQVEVIHDCGHAVPADQPERSWTAISRFIEG